MQSRTQMIYNLEHANDMEIERINDRLQQCNVRIVRTDGSTEISDIRTRFQLANALRDDETIDHAEYYFNGEWKIAQVS